MLPTTTLPPQVPAIVAPSDPTCTERGCPVPAPVPTRLLERGSGRKVAVNPYLDVTYKTNIDPTSSNPVEREMVLLVNRNGDEKLVDLATNQPRFAQLVKFVRCNFSEDWSIYESWTPEEEGVSEPF